MTWQHYPSTWYPPNNTGFPTVVRSFPEVERAAEGNTLENATKGLLIRTEESQVDTKSAPPTKDYSTSAENPGDSTDGDQQAAESSPTGYSRDAAAGALPDLGPGDYYYDGGFALQAAGVRVAATPLGLSAMHDAAAKIATESSHVLAGQSLFPMQDLLGPGPLTGLSIGTPSSRKDANADGSHQHGPLIGMAGGMVATGVAGPSGMSGDSKDLISKFNGLSPNRSRPRQLLPRPFHAGVPPITNTDTKNNETGSVRVARPPGQGRGRNQLLPRYWPRITDQELQQITSGEYPYNFLFFHFFLAVPSNF